MPPMRAILVWIWRYRLRIGLGLVSLAAIDLVQLIPPKLVGWTIDDLTHGGGQRLSKYVIGLIGTGIAIAALRFVWRFFLVGAGRRIRRDLRSELFAHLLKLEAGYFERKPTGELMALATNDIDAIGQTCGFGLLSLFDAVFMVAFVLIGMCLISPTLVMHALAPLPLMALFVLIAGRAIHRRFERLQERFGALTEQVRESIAGVRVIKGFAREDEFNADFARESRAYLRFNFRLIWLSVSFDPMITALAGSALLITLWFGGEEVIAGKISTGDFVAFMGYLATLTWPMMAAGWVVNLFQRGSASMKRIQEVLTREPGIADAAGSLAFPGTPSIACNHLTYTPPGKEQPTLRDISFELPAGKMLGVIGLTASGKTTLAHLMLRLIDPMPGALTVGGIDVRQIKLQDLRRHLVLVPQDPFLFALSVHENIAFARPDATRAEVESAARSARIHDEIAQFPKGYDTLIGERGVTLSGGQRQRVAIARAILADPRILVLDDCLSAVDAVTEAEVIANLRAFLAQRTSVVISHRLVAVRQADQIIVLEQGRVSERGTEAQLLAAGGLFARLHRLQHAESARA